MEEREFKPITSQEELDLVIKDRLNRQSEKHSRELSEKLASFEETKARLTESESKIGELTSLLEGNGTELDELKKQLEEKDALLSERDATLKKYERDSVKNNIATEYGIPRELADRLTGNTEEELRADAENLKAIIGVSKVPPLARNNGGNVNSREAALKQMSEALAHN